MKNNRKQPKAPRIRSITKTLFGPVLMIFWTDAQQTEVNLAGWIATGGDILAPLRDPDTFSIAHVAEHGAAIIWGDPGW